MPPFLLYLFNKCPKDPFFINIQLTFLYLFAFGHLVVVFQCMILTSLLNFLACTIKKAKIIRKSKSSINITITEFKTSSKKTSLANTFLCIRCFLQIFNYSQLASMWVPRNRQCQCLDQQKCQMPPKVDLLLLQNVNSQLNIWTLILDVLFEHCLLNLISYYIFSFE